MSFTHTILNSLIDDGGTVAAPGRALTGNANEKLNEPVAAGAADVQINIAFPASTMRSLWLMSTQNMTIKTNNATTPGDTINLKANIPLQWDVDGYGTNPITVDVTSFFVTNASATEVATLTMRLLSSA